MNESPTPSAAGEQISLGRLLTIFLQIGSLSWGGGGATLAMLHEAFCGRQRIVSEEEFEFLFGISRIVPGMNLLSLTVLLGHRKHGVLGAVTALAGLTAPSFTIIVLGCLWLHGGPPNRTTEGLIRGLRPAAAALLLHTGWLLCQGSLRKERPAIRAAWLLVALTTAMVSFYGWLHPAWAVVAAAGVGSVFLTHLRGRSPAEEQP